MGKKEKWEIENGKRKNYTDQTKQKKKDYTVESIDIGCRHSTENLKNKTAKKDPQSDLTKGWAVAEEVLDCPQLLLIATYPAMEQLESVISQCPLIKPKTRHYKRLKRIL